MSTENNTSSNTAKKITSFDNNNVTKSVRDAPLYKEVNSIIKMKDISERRKLFLIADACAKNNKCTAVWLEDASGGGFNVLVYPVISDERIIGIEFSRLKPVNNSIEYYSVGNREQIDTIQISADEDGTYPCDEEGLIDLFRHSYLSEKIDDGYTVSYTTHCAVFSLAIEGVNYDSYSCNHDGGDDWVMFKTIKCFYRTDELIKKPSGETVKGYKVFISTNFNWNSIKDYKGQQLIYKRG